MSGSIGVVVADDQAIVRAGFRMLIDSEPDLAVLGGFMLKERPPEELLAAIRVIAAGEALLAPNVTRRLIEHFARQPDPLRPPAGAMEQLTVREREVLALIATGLSDTEIAERLIMSVPTARTHVSRILAKLGARDRARLVVLAFRAGLVRPG